MKQILLLILLFLFANPIIACLNGDSYILNDGTFLYQDGEGNIPYGHNFYFNEFEKGIKQLDSLYKETKDLDYLSDKGLLLIVLKRYNEAIALYLEIEKSKPNRYSTASNLGTAYELSGQNDKALKWIKRSMEIDPESHENSEWIHIRILEAKIKGEQFYNTQFLLDTEFGSGIKPVSKMSRNDLQKLYKALYYQLNERVSFVVPKDKMVALLLFELGNIAFLLENYQDALGDYKLAEEYGLESSLLSERMKEAYRLSNVPPKVGTEFLGYQIQTKYLVYGLWGAGMLTCMGGVTIFYRRKRKKNPDTQK